MLPFILIGRLEGFPFESKAAISKRKVLPFEGVFKLIEKFVIGVGSGRIGRREDEKEEELEIERRIEISKAQFIVKLHISMLMNRKGRERKG